MPAPFAARGGPTPLPFQPLTLPYAAIDRASLKNRMFQVILYFEHAEMSDNIVLQDSQNRPQRETLGRFTTYA